MEKIICDTHAHTNLTDGKDAPKAMLARAAELGTEALALTDHFDMEREPDHRMRGAGTDRAYEATLAVKRGNKTGVKLLLGIEIGQMHRFRDEAREWLASHEYDFVLGSLHAVRGLEDDFYHLRNRVGLDADALLGQYFAETLELCETCEFDSLAHLTYPLRYIKGDVANYRKTVDEIFRVMIKKNIALEINGQMIGQAYNRLSPEEAEISRYRELGGRLITVGSDSHETGLIGNGIAACITAAKNAGFTEYAYYENRKAVFIKI